MEVLNFTVGDGFGLTLMEIAQEHLIYSLDPKKAVETFTKSMKGIPYTMVLKLIKGDMVIEVTEDQTFNVIKRS